MRRYFKNLLIALMGRNPYQIELDELREHYEKAAERVNELNEFYFKMVEKMDKTKKRMNDYQTLIENLRNRLAEKETENEQQGADFRERMERMKADYQKRIDEYNKTINKLKGVRPKTVRGKG